MIEKTETSNNFPTFLFLGHVESLNEKFSTLVPFPSLNYYIVYLCYAAFAYYSHFISFQPVLQ